MINGLRSRMTLTPTPREDHIARRHRSSLPRAHEKAARKLGNGNAILITPKQDLPQPAVFFFFERIPTRGPTWSPTVNPSW